MSGPPPTPDPRLQGPQHSPLSSICSWPDLVEATTLAAISLTVREHSCRRPRWRLCLSAFTWGTVGTGPGEPPGSRPTLPSHTHSLSLSLQHTELRRGQAKPTTGPHLGGRHQLCCAGRDLVGADDELFILAHVKHHFVSRLPGGHSRAGPGSPTPRRASWVTPPLPPQILSTTLPAAPPPGATYTSCVAPQPTALEAEMRPSVHREFLA